MITKFHSPNYSIRQGQIQFIIIHYTEMEFNDAVSKLCDSGSKVSAHYVIKADGEIFQLVADQYNAWHAGVSHWQNVSRLNEYSIGIELDNLGYESYPISQIQSCITLCNQLVKLHNIPRTNILAHSDIAPDRKIDPGPFFDWSYLAQHNLGQWCELYDKNCDEDLVIFTFGDRSDKISKLQRDLQRFGYQIKITGVFDIQTNYVVRAFQSHFHPNLIKKLGKDLYHDNNYRYSWDIVSHKLLQGLLK